MNLGLAELLVTFRETLEAALVVGIIYTFLVRAERSDLTRHVWRGTLAAVLASLAASVAFNVVAGGFEGRSEEIFEGVVMMASAVVLGTMITWMARNRKISSHLRERAGEVITHGDKAAIGIFLLAFVAVFREGIETVLFLYGVAMKEGGISMLTSLLGIALAATLGYIIFLQGQRIPLKTFFNVSSVLLIFLAAGLVAHGIHEFQEAGILPFKGALWDLNPHVIDGRPYPLLHEKGVVGSIMVGLFGWNGNPSLTELLFWMTSLVVITFSWRRAAAE